MNFVTQMSMLTQVEELHSNPWDLLRFYWWVHYVDYQESSSNTCCMLYRVLLLSSFETSLQYRSFNHCQGDFHKPGSPCIYLGVCFSHQEIQEMYEVPMLREVNSTWQHPSWQSDLGCFCPVSMNQRVTTLNFNGSAPQASKSWNFR